MKIKLNPTALYAIKMSASNQNLRTSKAKLNTKIVFPFFPRRTDSPTNNKYDVTILWKWGL